jgi:hypothetical protein
MSGQRHDLERRDHRVSMEEQEEKPRVGLICSPSFRVHNRQCPKYFASYTEMAA